MYKREGSFTLEAVRHIRPYEQGALDGLCGLYAIINAIKLALCPHRPLKTIEAWQMFEAGLYHIDKNGRDLAAYVRDGMEWRILRMLAEKLCSQASVKPLLLSTERIPYPAIYSKRVEAIEKSIIQSWPVIINIEPMAHYSVISGYTATRFKLFDSDDAKWITRNRSKLSLAIAIKCEQRTILDA